MNYHSGTGKIVYEPFRGKMKRNDPWWCVIEVDKEITRYYRWWLQKERHILLNQPSWDAHISVVAAKKPVNISAWKKYHGQSVDFSYFDGEIYTTKDPDGGWFHWVTAVCQPATDLRLELGLPGYTKFHITIGRTYY